MVEIKTETIDPQPAKAGRESHRVSADAYEVSWSGYGGSVFCFHYTKGGSLTPADFRKFSVVLSEIADTLDIQQVPEEARPHRVEVKVNG